MDLWSKIKLHNVTASTPADGEGIRAIKMIKVSYVVPSEETAKTSSGRAVVLNPFIRREISIPSTLNFAVSIALVFDNAELNDLHMHILDPDLELLSDTDVVEVHFDKNELYDSKTGKRKSMTIAAEISLSSEEGIQIEKEGIHRIQLLSEGEVLSENFFYVVDTNGDDNE